MKLRLFCDLQTQAWPDMYKILGSIPSTVWEKQNTLPAVVAHICKYSTQEAKTRALKMQGLLKWYSKL